MSMTNLYDLQAQIQKAWAPMFVDELKEQALLPNLVNKEYSGDIKKQGNEVTVSMIRNATGSKKSINAAGDHLTIDSEKIATVNVDVKADTVFEAAFEIDDLVDLQNQLGSPDGQSKIRQALLKGIELQLNKHLYELVAPTTATSGVTDFNASQILNLRKLASQAKWPQDNRWLLADPSYMNDILSAQTLTSSDYVDDRSVVAGQIVNRRFGFNILEDNSDAMKYISPTEATADLAIAFHPDFMLLVMQREPTFKLSDLHSNKQRGYLLSVDMIGGAKLGVEGADKHLTVYDA